MSVCVCYLNEFVVLSFSRRSKVKYTFVQINYVHINEERLVRCCCVVVWYSLIKIPHR